MTCITLFVIIRAILFQERSFLNTFLNHGNRKKLFIHDGHYIYTIKIPSKLFLSLIFIRIIYIEYFKTKFWKCCNILCSSQTSQYYWRVKKIILFSPRIFLPRTTKSAILIFSPYIKSVLHIPNNLEPSLGRPLRQNPAYCSKGFSPSLIYFIYFRHFRRCRLFFSCSSNWYIGFL